MKFDARILRGALLFEVTGDPRKFLGLGVYRAYFDLKRKAKGTLDKLTSPYTRLGDKRQVCRLSVSL